MVAEDYANDAVKTMEDCEEPEWTIFSETVKENDSEHCGVTTGGKSMQKGRPGGGIQHFRRQ